MRGAVLLACVWMVVAPQVARAFQQPAARTRDSVGGELVVRVLDVGQGDATYITNGSSRVFIDGGPDTATLGRYLDSLGLDNSTIDVVIVSHAHLDHYSGLRELFRTSRNIKVRYFFENKDPSTAVTLSVLRDSILSRMDRDSLVYRDTDDPCSNGVRICTITMNGGARLHIMAPHPTASTQNDRSTPVKLVGPDSASFTMWFGWRRGASHTALVRDHRVRPEPRHARRRPQGESSRKLQRRNRQLPEAHSAIVGDSFTGRSQRLRAHPQSGQANLSARGHSLAQNRHEWDNHHPLTRDPRRGLHGYCRS